MQLIISLYNNRQFSFTVADGQESLEFLNATYFWEIFDRPVLRVHDHRDTWALNPATIETIKFDTTEDPKWQPPENIISFKCLTPETYREKCATLEAKLTQPAPLFEAGKFIESVFEVSLASGAVVYFECFLMLRQHWERMMNLHHLFQKLACPVLCEHGGYILLNPKHIVCIHMHPCLPEDQGVWIVSGCADSAVE